MVFVSILMLLRVLPFELSVAAARLLLRVYLTLFGRARRELRRAVEELGTGSYTSGDYIRQTAINAALMAKMGTSFARRLERSARIEGEENLRGLKGGVVATFHFGPWELMAEAFSMRGYRVGALVGSQKMPVFEGYLAAMRRRAGLKDVTTLKEAKKALENGLFLAALYDKTRRAKGEALGVPYHDYSSSVIPSRLAHRSRTPLIPVMCEFSRNRFEVKIGKPDGDPASFFRPFFEKKPCHWLVWGK